MELDKFLEKICVFEKVIVELLPRHGDFNPWRRFLINSDHFRIIQGKFIPRRLTISKHDCDEDRQPLYRIQSEDRRAEDAL